VTDDSVCLCELGRDAARSNDNGGVRQRAVPPLVDNCHRASESEFEKIISRSVMLEKQTTELLVLSALSQAAQQRWTVVRPIEINRNMENSTPCKIVIPENFILKHGTRDYVEDVTYYTNRRNIVTL